MPPRSGSSLVTLGMVTHLSLRDVLETNLVGLRLATR
jgi:hypothetical protein